jgi:hypothetical protein
LTDVRTSRVSCYLGPNGRVVTFPFVGVDIAERLRILKHILKYIQSLDGIDELTGRPDSHSGAVIGVYEDHEVPVWVSQYATT